METVKAMVLSDEAAKDTAPATSHNVTNIQALDRVFISGSPLGNIYASRSHVIIFHSLIIAVVVIAHAGG